MSMLKPKTSNVSPEPQRLHASMLSTEKQSRTNSRSVFQNFTKSHNDLKKFQLQDMERSVISNEESQVSPQPKNQVSSMLTNYQERTDKGRNALLSAEQKYRRSHDTQSKLNEVRRKLKSQGNGRAARTRKGGLDLPNNQGGWQVGLVADNLGEVPLNNFALGAEKKVNPLTVTRQGFLNKHKRHATAFDLKRLDSTTEASYMEGVKKIRSSKLVNVDPMPELTFDDMYQNNNKKEANYFNPQFGCKGYVAPGSNQLQGNYKIKKISFAREQDKNKKRTHFLDAVAKLAKQRPDCKISHDDWSQKSFTMGGHFLKGKKVLMTERVMQVVKKKNVPGPGQYPITDPKKPRSYKQSKGDKCCSFIEHAQWKSEQGPGPGNRADKINFKIVEPNPRPATFWKESDKQKEKGRLKVIPKDKKTPAMGDYDINRARPITEQRQRAAFLPMGKRESFIDIAVRKNEWRLPPGAYFKTRGDRKSDIGNAFRALSVSPSLKMKRL